MNKPYLIIISLPAAVVPPPLLLLGPVLRPLPPPLLLQPLLLQAHEAAALERVRREGAGVADAVHQVRPGGQPRGYRRPAGLEALK